jgi:pimeloyl-ACP methyl ester carboxylesterase
MATFVLVPGAWLGGWAWQPVARQLRDRGHDVYPVTLTGLGDRSHLARPEVDLETHITDVVNLLETEDVRDVILVGHSYAGIVVTGVADRVPGRIAQLAYQDSGPVPDGLSYLDTQEPEVKQHALTQVERHGDGWRLPVPTWEELETVNGASLAGLGDEQRARMRSRAVPQPFATYTQPLRLENDAARAALPKLLITNSFPLEQVRQLIDGGHPWFRELAGPEWRLLELPTGHWAMFSVPDELARLLDKLPAG